MNVNVGREFLANSLEGLNLLKKLRTEVSLIDGRVIGEFEERGLGEAGSD